MTETEYRLIMGSLLIILLYISNPVLISAYIMILFFEGITNLRLVYLVNFLLKKPAVSSQDLSTLNKNSRFSFDSERALRIIIGIFLICSYFIFPEALWFFPWLIGFMLFASGVTNLCPMNILLKLSGFR